MCESRYTRHPLVAGDPDRPVGIVTCLGRSIVMPYARIAHLTKPLLFITRPDVPITTGIEDETVRLLFILLTPQGMPRVHQRLQARIAGLLESEFVHECPSMHRTPRSIPRWAPPT